ncbi:Crp/Fnr family transcriptional regulator [Tenacibaculum tangerinum]|uniref:Crp/Fnr family transcriptional regulator n=1 Tax=Tenacibaculum tangerinum TaxID=3038772 RepID=A0ABY8L5U2_9FLAO|nr:Crp/Fnr family transcriptional regulator [Tenacibaculum tangerinum]WGH75553.1 Crp/Fnr family transcriptional regulator [Tenacibaculum tangerinum]
MDFFRNFAQNFHPSLSEDTFKQMLAFLSIRHFPKNYELVSLDEKPTYFYVVKKGIIRSYNISSKGKEHTKTIYTPTMTSGNLGALIKNEPSKLIYECLTDCEVLQCNYEKLYELSLKNHEVSIFHYKVLQSVYIREESKILELQMLNATQRYKKLQKQLPGIDNLINQYHIASYLNITPVQLSRIRKNLIY